MIFLAGLNDIYQTSISHPERQQKLKSMRLNASIYIYDLCMKRANYGAFDALVNLKEFMQAALGSVPFFNFNDEWNRLDAVNLLQQTVSNISPMQFTSNSNNYQVMIQARYFDPDTYMLSWNARLLPKS